MFRRGGGERSGFAPANVIILLRRYSFLNTFKSDGWWFTSVANRPRSDAFATKRTAPPHKVHRFVAIRTHPDGRRILWATFARTNCAVAQIK